MDSGLLDQVERYNQNLLERDAKFTKIRNTHNIQQDENNRVEHIVRLAGKDIDTHNVDEEIDRLHAHYDEAEYDYDEYEVEFVPDANDPIIKILTEAANIPMFAEDKNKESKMYNQPQYSNQQPQAVKVINCFDGQPIRMPNGQFLLLPEDIAPRVPVTVGIDDYNRPQLNQDGMPLLAFDRGDGTFIEWNPTAEANFIRNQQQQQPQQQQSNNPAVYGGYGMQPAKEETNPYVTDRYSSTDEPVAQFDPRAPRDFVAKQEPAVVTEEKFSGMFIELDGEEIQVLPIEDMTIRAVERFPELAFYDNNFAIVAGYVNKILTEFMVRRESMERTIEYNGEGKLELAFEGGRAKDLPKAKIKVAEHHSYIRDVEVTKDELLCNSVSDMKSVANDYYYGKDKSKRDSKVDYALLSTVNYDVTMNDLTPIHDRLIDYDVMDVDTYIEYLEIIRSGVGGNKRTFALIDKLVTRYINDLISSKLNVVTVGVAIESFYEDYEDLHAYFEESDVPGHLDSYLVEMGILFGKVIDFSIDETEHLIMQISAPLVSYAMPLDIPEGRIIFDGCEELYFLIRSVARSCNTNTVFVHTYDNYVYQVAINSELHTPAVFVTKKH